MLIKCLNCGKEFLDDYDGVNQLNKRIYCDECVDKLWTDRKIKQCAKCGEFRKHFAKGKCKSCYNSSVRKSHREE